MSARILLVEDEPSLRMAIEDALTGHGFDVVAVADGAEGEERALRDAFDLILLDVMLPTRDGFTVLRNLRADRLAIPVVLLTARGDEFDRVQGFESGADDYVVKPFSTAEVLARLRAALARKAGATPGVGELADVRRVRFGDVEVDFDAYTLRRGGERFGLLPREMDLLRYLMRHEGEPLERTRIIDDVWDAADEPTLRTVDQHVMKLRKKVERDPAAPRHILTVRRVGYRFVRGSSGPEGTGSRPGDTA